MIMNPVAKKADSRFSATLQKAKTGDRKSCNELYGLMAAKMYSLCMRYTGNAMDAELSFHAGLVQVFSKLAMYNEMQSFDSWARSIFISACINVINSKEEISHSKLTKGVTVNLPAGRSEWSADELHKALQLQPASHRIVANLCLVDEYPPEEAGRLLNIPVGAIRHSLQMFMEQLENDNRFIPCRVAE